MDAPDGVLDERGEREVVKDLSAIPPHVNGAVLAEAFVVKPIDLCDLSALVVAADQGNPIGIPDLIDMT